MRSDLTASRARELLAYYPGMGILRWRVSPRRGVHAGSLAGYLNTSTGYVIVMIDGRNYRAHRLAWLIVHGVWPEHEIDHINGRRADNRLINLREASHAENGRNLKLKKNNTSGCPGVYFHKKSGKWVAYIDLSGKRQSLGSFIHLDEASAARRAAEQRHFGNFARCLEHQEG